MLEVAGAVEDQEDEVALGDVAGEAEEGSSRR